MLINDYSTYEAWKHTEQPKGLRHALDTSNLNKYTGLQTCMCVRHVCRWIFMNATREILTVYKEGAYRPIGVCIFNRFCTFPSFRCEKLMKLFVFSFYSNSEYFYFFSATEGIFFFFFFRQTMFSPNCQYHKFTILQYTWSKIALTAVWPPFGQPTYILKECCEIFEHHTFELLCCEAESAGLKPLFTPAKNRTVE